MHTIERMAVSLLYLRRYGFGQAAGRELARAEDYKIRSYAYSGLAKLSYFYLSIDLFTKV